MKILVSVVNWTGALLIQRKLLDMYCGEKYELVAFVDTPTKPSRLNFFNSNLRKVVIEEVSRLADRCIVVPEEAHKFRQELFGQKTESAINPVTRCADILQLMWIQEMIDSTEPIIVLDSDMFPFKEFSSKNFGVDKYLCAVPQARRNDFSEVNYFWNGLLFMKPNLIPNPQLWSFDCGQIEGLNVDVGGQLHHWISSLSHDQRSGIREISHYSSGSWEFARKNLDLGVFENYVVHDDRNLRGKAFSEIYDDGFFHFRAGSNWRFERTSVVMRRRAFFESNFHKLLE
jgi:hypothetical protein